jgi:hypothetical protein
MHLNQAAKMSEKMGPLQNTALDCSEGYPSIQRTDARNLWMKFTPHGSVKTTLIIVLNPTAMPQPFWINREV